VVRISLAGTRTLVVGQDRDWSSDRLNLSLSRVLDAIRSLSS
jgi:hypothetical protein